MPPGFYQADNVPYPKPRPTSNRDLLGNVIDPAMEPDAGIGGQSFLAPQSAPTAAPQKSMKDQLNAQFANTGDPYEDTRQRRITDLADEGRHQAGASFLDVGPAKRIGIGPQDEQALEALGPEYAAEANRLASLPSAQRPAMYAKIGDKEFYGMPGARVSRQALLPGLMRIASEKAAQEKRQQQATEFDRQKALAEVPGNAAVRLAEKKGDYALKGQESQQNFERPEQAARIAESGQKIAGAKGAEARAQRQFDESMDPANKQRAAADAAIKALQESGAANTPEGRQTIAALAKFSTIGSRLPGDTAQQYATATSQPSPAQKLTAMSEAMQDPTLTGLISKIKETAQGSLLASPTNRQTQQQYLDQLNKHVQMLAAAKNLDPQDIWVAIRPDIERHIKKKSFAQELSESNPFTRFIDRQLGNNYGPESEPFQP